MAAPAFAQRNCSAGDSAAAGKALDRASNWPALYKAYKDYQHCDKGDIGETYTDAILRLLVDWKNIDSIASLYAKDAEFKSFMEKHLLSPAAKDDLPSVYSRAKTMCPASQAAFCAELAEIVKSTKGGSAPAPSAAPEVLDFTPMKPINKP
jgi:hypothetical protein